MLMVSGFCMWFPCCVDGFSIMAFVYPFCLRGVSVFSQSVVSVTCLSKTYVFCIIFCKRFLHFVCGFSVSR